MLLRYCQLNNLFYCYSNCPTANFTFFSSATVTALLCYCQPHKMFYCCSNCATVLLCYCATVSFTVCSSADVLLRYCTTANFTNLSYTATANFTNLSYCATALLLTSHTPYTQLITYVIISGCWCAYGSFTTEDHGGCWLVGFVALRPKSTAMVIAGRSVHLTTLFPGQAWTSG